MNEYDDLLTNEANANEYDDLLALNQDQARQRLRASMLTAQRQNPDQYGQAKQIERDTGIPAPVAARNLPEVQQRTRLNEYDQLLQTSPKLAERLQNPDFASLAHDDIEALANLEAQLNPRLAVGKINGPAFQRTAVIQSTRGPEATLGSVLSGLGNSLAEGGIRTRASMQMQFADALGFSEMQQRSKTAYEQSTLRQATETPQFDSTTARYVYGGAENVLQNLPGLTAAILTRNPYIALAPGVLQTETQGYGDTRLRGGSPLEAGAVGGLQGVVEAATEYLPMKFLVDKIGHTTLLRLFAGEQIREQLGEQVATHMQDAIDTAIANPDKTWADYWKERPDAALQTAVGVLMQGALLTGMSAFAGRHHQAATAEQNAQALKQMGEWVKQSKLHPRDSQSFQQFVDAAAADGPVQDVFIDARTFAQSLQQAGMDPGQLAQVSPSVAQQLTGAVESGGDIQIPVGEYAAKIAATPAADVLLPHLRTAPEAMSRDEAQTFMQSQADEFKAQAEQMLAQHEFDSATQESAANVERELMTQLKQANRFTDDVNGAYAKLMSAFYSVNGARLGITPEEMYVRYPLQIRADSVLGGAQMRMDQGHLFAADLSAPESGQWSDTRETTMGNTTVRYAVNADGNIEIYSIQTPSEHRGQGSARNAMNEFLAHADAEGRSVKLAAAPLDRSTSGERLRGFYQSLGFEDTGRRVNGTGDTEMLREPAAMMAQGAPTGARGNITFGKNIQQTPTIISLLQNADLSTFLHESGHFYLEVLTDIARQPDAPASVVDDANRVLHWFGVPDLATWDTMSIEQKRPFHEQFARGMEAYLFEGKAPNHELQGLFARFRAWLVNVYRQLTALNVQLSDEVRGVFDRMLATNEQIVAAETARAYTPLFANAEQAGMTPEEWQQYQALGNQATQEAVDHLQTRSLRDMQWLSNAKSRALKKLQRDAKAQRAAIEAEVRAEVEAEPVNQARRFIRTGETTDPQTGETIKVEQGHKINTDALKAMYPETMLGRPDLSGLRGMTSPEGLHPDMLAEMFGFTSGDHLVRSLLEAEDPKVTIEGMTDQRMLERYGDLSSPDAIERAANEAIHNEARARFVAAELGALEKALQVRQDTGQKVVDIRGRVRRVTVDVMAKAAREFAKTTIARRKLRDIKPAQYEAAEARAAKAAKRAVVKGELGAAATEKRNQMFNAFTAKEAYRAQDEIDRGLRYLKRVAASDSIDISYREQIAAILDRYELRKITDKEAARRQSLVEWVEAQREQGLEPVIDPAVLDEARRVPFRELTLEQFRGVVDSIKNIEHLGRLKKKLLTAKDEREFGQRVDEAAASIRDNAKRTIPAKLESNTWADKMRSGTAEVFAMHRKFASLVREMDGYDDNGVLWNLFSRPMNEAGDREAVLREQATIKLSELFDPILKAGKMREKQFIPAINASLSREGRIMVALNTGNEGNLQRLMDGDGWSPEQVRAITDTLTKEEWDFVQSVWDFIESYRGEIGAQQKRLTGVEPEWVEPTPVQTRFGTYRGGYIPAKYDTNRSTRSLADEASQNIMDMWRAQRGRAKTRDSFTKARASAVVDRPLRKDFGVITQHVTEVTHRLAWQEFLTDANRLMRAGAIDSAIREHYGPEVLKAMRGTIQDIAAGEVGAQNAFERGLNYLRSGATVAGLGWRLTTALMQPIGLTQSMSRIGTKYVARGLAEWLGDAAKMENTVARINAKSSMMRLRAKTMQREISEIRNKVSGKDSAIEASYFYLIQKLQLVADVPTWLGQYHKAIENGADEDTAVAQADQAVLDAQGGGQIKDLAGIQRGGPMWKLFTNFYSFFSTTFNLTSDAVGRTNFKDPVSVGYLAVDMLLLYTIPAVLGTLVKAALHGDDDWGKLTRQLISDQITYLFGTMVGVRELAGAAQTALGLPGDYQGLASLRVFSEIAKLTKQANQGQMDEALLKSANNVGGILFHYPAGQVNSTLDGIRAMVEGRTQNPGALLVGGPPRH